MNPMKSLSLIVCMILAVGYLTPVQAVTDAELEALEKQIEQQEAEEKKQIETEEKKKTEAAAKRKDELEKQQMEKAKRVAEKKRKAEEEKHLMELEKQRQEVEQKRIEEEVRKAVEARLAELELERKRKEEDAKKREEEIRAKKALLTPVISIVSGTYGANCGAPKGNVTQHLATACNGRKRCEYIVDYKVIGDPVYGCGKTYNAEWKCSENGQVFRTKLSPEAGYRKTAILNCEGAQTK